MSCDNNLYTCHCKDYIHHSLVFIHVKFNMVSSLTNVYRLKLKSLFSDNLLSASILRTPVNGLNQRVELVHFYSFEPVLLVNHFI